LPSIADGVGDAIGLGEVDNKSVWCAANSNIHRDPGDVFGVVIKVGAGYGFTLAVVDAAAPAAARRLLGSGREIRNAAAV